MHAILSTFVLLLVARLGAAWLPLLIRRWPGQQHQLFTVLFSGLVVLGLLSMPFSNRSLADEQSEGVAQKSAVATRPPASSEPVEPRAQEFRDAVLLYISEQDFHKLLVRDEQGGLVGLDQLQQGFTLIPLPAAGPVAFPAAMRRVLSPAGMQILEKALSQILELTPGQSSSEIAASFPAANEKDGLSSEPPLAIPEAEGARASESSDLPGVTVTVATRPTLADWVHSPDVVKSEFLEASVSAEDALREPVLQKLEERIDQLVRQQWGTAIPWRKLVHVVVPNQVIRQCIVRSDARTEVIETSEGSHPMRQTYALLDIPPFLEAQIMERVQQGIQRNRMITLCLALGTLWLAIIAFSAACRATRGSSLLRKLAAFPVMAALMIPCLLVSVLLLESMISGRLLPVPQPTLQVLCASEPR
jgi:hypothetical protein